MTSGFSLPPPIPSTFPAPHCSSVASLSPPHLLCLPVTLVEGYWVPGPGKAEELLRAQSGAGYPPAGWRELGLVGAPPWGQRRRPGRGHRGHVVWGPPGQPSPHSPWLFGPQDADASESGGSQDQHGGDDIQAKRGPHSGSRLKGPGPERCAQEPGPLLPPGPAGPATEPGGEFWGPVSPTQTQTRLFFVLG